MTRKRTRVHKPKLTADMSGDEVARAVKVLNRSRYIAGLYGTYGQDLAAILDEQRALHDGLTSRGIWCMFDDIEAELLYLFIREMGFGMALEIGSGCGWSTTWMLHALKLTGGKLLSLDRDTNTPEFVPSDLAGDRWDFSRMDVRDTSGESLAQLDFLLVDTDHQPNLVEWIIEHVFPLVRPGGRIAVHDVFALATPAHGEAVAIFRHLDRIGVRPYTPSHCFAASHRRINGARREAGIDPDKLICPNKVNPLLVFDVP